MRTIKKILIVLTLAMLPSYAGAIDLSLLDQENLMKLRLHTGTVTIEMRPDKAPNTVARVKELVREGFYDGLTFHRVVEGFMAQTGDPLGDGTGGSGQPLAAEFNSMRLIRGRTAMARQAEDENSADSQFFIMLDTKRLPAKYTAWGRVVDGMNHVDEINVGNPRDNGNVEFPDKILRAWIAADE
jgi:peptidylprolyl isomerase